MTVPPQKDAWDDLYKAQPRQWKGPVRNETPFPFAKGDKILDVGCGNGKTSTSLIESGHSVVGIDISEAAVKICRELYGDKMGAVCASADSLPFEDDNFDGIVMFHVLEHLTGDERKAAVKEARRVLKTNGKIFVRAFSTDDMRSDKGERMDERTVIRGNGIMYRYFDENEVNRMFSEFVPISIKRVEERTKFKEIRSRIEAVYQKPA